MGKAEFEHPELSQSQATRPDEVIDHTFALLEEIRNKKEPYFVSINGREIVVYPGVFCPTTESRLLTDHIDCSQSERVLDITTGCGVSAVIAGLQGATGIAVDINAQAVANANANFQRFGIQMHAVESDLFQNVPREKFDLILCNPPYYEGTPTDPLEYAIFGGRDFIGRLFENMKSFVKPEGKTLITYAEWAGDTEFFEQKAQDKGYSLSVVNKRASMDKKRIYRLYEAKIINPNYAEK